ncbi:MAG: phenylalanine--tRNA ligase subunit beta [Candidatus Dactylopiibacterium carminicum]|uniref:Phenylalanine--tRNA ligase beta subunit n=1 Tax=Candidatus Dactylopiibacterium carminicum TaxID=857335 RepID=A0A272ERB9_9RHOO|nr:phenylalanine--tRNA ligase subunit beta [Candidatus Dactylopiibacterium carminicum]KAF7598729.1 phenylalanine--tRNA ligase subunit beta [Candidatus Dactylopiibacterium carminicum]PAS92641.1 MAG: phenylalanine--tRNA ligase subunit beta [Candidatus Dactylopiibacterium carminicum]PAS96131.1 MAG: phenylalanine--tRNA ligase subunit beta [Candidatus Dactylopiibacterium carminicum]PAS98749.1 MAG: phenylalanine--tRNA ligase subunit beta [Candidatus Dactylopiibacterium carminicum]
MQFSESWLRTLCNPSLDSEALCHLLTMAGLEVEEVEPVAPPFSGVVVGQIVSFEKHPNADKLKVCRVDVGADELLQIVCGAPNVVEGMKAPCACVGAKLPGFEIKAAKLRGLESFGMMCSASELGLSQDHDGLLALPEDAPVGADIRSYLDLDDRKITIKLTPNRADCLSLAGVARELAALTDTPLQAIVTPDVPVGHERQRKVHLDAPLACPRYLGRVITGVNAQADTPEWMRERLARSGLRSISAAVDITNYVMLELGQPLHAFDNGLLQGDIHVRHPQPGEKLVLLNGDEVTPAADMLLVADEGRPLALAGIMGGENSGVTDATTEIFLESAFFHPDAIVGRARILGFSSDASHRFERGVDFALPAQAMERATALILGICGGVAGSVFEAIEREQLPQRQIVPFRPERARKLLGFNIADDAMHAALARLGMQVKASVGGLEVTPPSYRFDINIEEDLVEEVARIHGYDSIPACPPVGPAHMLPSSEFTRPAHRARRALAALDYQEIISYAFVDEAWERDFAANEAPIRLANPIASQMSVMRSTLLGGLIGALAGNLRRRAPRVRLFELGRCFRKDETFVTGYAQPVRLAGLAWGTAEPEQWGQAARSVDFFDVKHDVEILLAGRAQFVAARHPALHPGRCAEVKLGADVIGVLGELHPALVQRYGLGAAPMVFELELDAVLSTRLPQAQDISRQPVVQRDLALVLRNEISADSLRGTLEAAGGEYLRSVTLFDVYSGKGVEPGFRSIALRVVLQHTERTLEEAEIEACMRGLVAAVEQQLGGRLRA